MLAVPATVADLAALAPEPAEVSARGAGKMTAVRMALHGPLEIGALFLGKYEILALIGRGGHACVYHAVNSFMGRHVAIKVLHRPGGIDQEALRRGQAEAQILNRLRHPNIVEVSDAGMTEAGLLYIVMELLDGRSLREVLNQHGSLAVHEVLALAADIADGLHTAHVTGAIHRDLKPENVFVTRTDGVKILDFGIAKVADAAAWTTDGDVAQGTALYMSPEQFQLAKLTPRSDIYALGVVMYEALLGRHPVPLLIDSPSPTVWEISRAVLTREPPMLDELDARIPRGVAALVNRAMAKRPEQRFESMAELERSLRECRSTWLAYAQVHNLPVADRDLAVSAAAAPPASASSVPRSNSPRLAGSVKRQLTPGTAAPVTTRATPIASPRGRTPRLRLVVALGVLFGSSVGAVGGWLRLHTAPPDKAAAPSAAVTAAVTSRPTTTDPPSALPVAPLVASSTPMPVESAPTAAPSSTAERRPPPRSAGKAAARRATTNRFQTAAAPADAPREPTDKVDQRLRRLERSLDDEPASQPPRNP